MMSILRIPAGPTSTSDLDRVMQHIRLGTGVEVNHVSTDAGTFTFVILSLDGQEHQFALGPYEEKSYSRDRAIKEALDKLDQDREKIITRSREVELYISQAAEVTSLARQIRDIVQRAEITR
jgi:hypothetical protein